MFSLVELFIFATGTAEHTDLVGSQACRHLDMDSGPSSRPMILSRHQSSPAPSTDILRTWRVDGSAAENAPESIPLMRCRVIGSQHGRSLCRSRSQL